MKKRLKLLRLVTALPVGGIERMIADVLPRLDRDRFEVHCVCTRERGALADELDAAGIPVHVIKFNSRWDPLALRRLRALIAAEEYDILHSSLYRANVPGTVVKLLRRRIVHIAHYDNVDSWDSPRQILVDRLLAHRRDMNIAVSNTVRDDVMRRLQLPPEKIVTIYNGVNIDKYRPLAPGPERDEIRRSLGFEPQHLLVPMVARLHPQKNQQMVIRAVRELAGEFPNLRILLIGIGPDESRLRALADEAQVHPHLQFLGRRDDVPRILPAMDVSILPSLKEGFSIAVIETMACGIPMIVSRVGGNHEIMESGLNGYVLDAHFDPQGSANMAASVDQKQFVETLGKLLRDEALRLRIGGAARARALEFSIERMVQQHEELYERLATPLAERQTA